MYAGHKHAFKVVKERFGWAVLSHDGMSMPLGKRSMAVRTRRT